MVVAGATDVRMQQRQFARAAAGGGRLGDRGRAAGSTGRCRRSGRRSRARARRPPPAVRGRSCAPGAGCRGRRGSPAPGAACSRRISVVSVAVAGPMAAASRPIRSIVHSAWRRCARGMCSGNVVCRPRAPPRTCTATRSPLWNSSMVRAVMRASTCSRSSRCGTE